MITKLRYGVPTGGAVTIIGRRLQAATLVTVNGIVATVTGNTSTRITVIVPSGAVGGPVTVTTPLGTATAHGFPIIP